VGFANVIVLLEPRQLVLIPAGETQRTIALDALRVAKVTDNLLYIPLAGLWATGS